MDNLDLQKKVMEIVATPNMFDAIMEMKNFEKDYKASDFYKATKMPIEDVIKYGKMWYTYDVDSIGSKIQDFVNNLDLEHLMELINQIGDTFSKENEEILGAAQTLKDIVKQRLEVKYGGRRKQNYIIRRCKKQCQ